MSTPSTTCCGSPDSTPSTNPSEANLSAHYDTETIVLERYKAGAQTFQASLCCAVEYDPEVLDHLPSEIIEKDYGCGDPTRYVEPGEQVIDLGSGAGKNCYILAKKVGATGQITGIDFNDEMLNLSRKYQSEIAEKLGYANVRFLKAKIQDLSLNLALVSDYLQANPIHTLEDWGRFEAICDRFRQEQPLISTNTIDVVISNCVLNLVRSSDKKQLFEEIYRVLKPGGRAIISDIVCDRDPTPEILADPDLWSGCIAGAFREDHFPQQFEQAGFTSIEILVRQDEPWQVIQDVEFRSMTIRAYKSPSLNHFN